LLIKTSLLLDFIQFYSFMYFTGLLSVLVPST